VTKAEDGEAVEDASLEEAEVEEDFDWEEVDGEDEGGDEEKAMASDMVRPAPSECWCNERGCFGPCYGNPVPSDYSSYYGYEKADLHPMVWTALF